MKSWPKRFLSLAVVASTFGFGYLGYNYTQNRSFALAEEKREEVRAGLAHADDLATAFRAVGHVVEPSVVNINVRKKGPDIRSLPIDPATVEQEYLDASARFQAKVEAGLAWDERTGLATLRNDVDRRVAAARRYEKRLAHTKPATPAGAAALIQYVLDDDLEADENYWHMTALRSAVAALNGMGAAVQS